MLRLDPAYAEKAARVSALAKDVTEFLSELDLPLPENRTDLVVAYHSACSMQHGQRLTRAPKVLLAQAGFTVRDVPEGHLCCGSAGTYNILQPEIATAAARPQGGEHREHRAPAHRHRQYRLHDADRLGDRHSRSSTRSSSSTGPLAARSRRALPGSHRLRLPRRSSRRNKGRGDPAIVMVHGDCRHHGAGTVGRRLRNARASCRIFPQAAGDPWR